MFGFQQMEVLGVPSVIQWDLDCAGIQIKKSPGRQVYAETVCYCESCKRPNLPYFAMFWPFVLGE